MTTPSFLCDIKYQLYVADIIVWLLYLVTLFYIQLLRSIVTDSYFVMKPLTLQSATLTSVLPQYNVNLEKCVRITTSKSQRISNSAEAGEKTPNIYIPLVG